MKHSDIEWVLIVLLVAVMAIAIATVDADTFRSLLESRVR